MRPIDATRTDWWRHLDGKLPCRTVELRNKFARGKIEILRPEIARHLAGV